MAHRSKIKRNETCPCLSGEKYKRCCLGKVDWDAIVQGGVDDRPYLSLRGRNLYFVTRIFDALQFDKPGKAISSKDFKAAFTAGAVRKIHEAVMEVWPPDIDIVGTLKAASGDVSGLYIGDYSPEYLTRAIVRHSIYANRILLIDPFVYPPSVKDEYDPIMNPEQYRAQTLRYVNLWFALLPWIDAGLVAFIRPPSDFDSQMNSQLIKAQEEKFRGSAELQKASKESVEELKGRHSKILYRQQFFLGAPDSYLRQKIRMHSLPDGLSEEEFFNVIHRERERDPDVLDLSDPSSEGQLYILSSGTSYSHAVMTAGLTGSYLFTDMHVRWREIELDRESHSAENKVWAPFAKALQNAHLKYLNSLRLEHALTLRKEGRLESLRGFLGKVWRGARVEDQFGSENAILLTEELGERIRETEQEWKKIDADLIKLFGSEVVAGLLAAGPLIASGHAAFLAAAAAVRGVLPLVNSTLQRRSFPDRFPAAFFMKIEGDDGPRP